MPLGSLSWDLPWAISSTRLCNLPLFNSAMLQLLHKLAALERAHSSRSVPTFSAELPPTPSTPSRRRAVLPPCKTRPLLNAMGSPTLQAVKVPLSSTSAPQHTDWSSPCNVTWERAEDHYPTREICYSIKGFFPGW